VDKTTVFNLIAFLLAVGVPVLTGAGFTGEVPSEWAIFIPAVIAAINMFLKRFSKTEAGRAMNV